MSEISFDKSNPAFHEAAWNVFIKSGCPKGLAYQGAQIIGRDNPYAKDLGRTEEDRKIMKEIVRYINTKRT